MTQWPRQQLLKTQETRQQLLETQATRHQLLETQETRQQLQKTQQSRQAWSILKQLPLPLLCLLQFIRGMSEHESNMNFPSRWSLYLSFALCVDHLSLSIIQRRYYSMSAIWIMNLIPLLLCAPGIWVEASSAIEYFAPKAVWSTLVMSGNVNKQPK